MAWTVETLNTVVDAEVNALPGDMRARLFRISSMIEEFGPERMRGRDGISRALYVGASERRVVIVRVFVKKTQTTPNREIELALSRAQELLP